MEKKEYIERGAVLERNMRGNTAPITCRTYAERLISSAPAADVAPVVHGEWIKCKGMILTYQCNECRSYYTKHAISNPDYNYCPYCGAKMDGVKEK